jgi:hypothetical protein
MLWKWRGMDEVWVGLIGFRAIFFAGVRQGRRGRWSGWLVSIVKEPDSLTAAVELNARCEDAQVPGQGARLGAAISCRRMGKGGRTCIEFKSAGKEILAAENFW